jgi:cell wall-associated NlpC family hydrolase
MSHRRVMRGAVLAAVAAGAVASSAVGLVVAGPAGASVTGPAAYRAASTATGSGARIRAALEVATESRTGAILVRGWAFDRRHPTASITVGIWSRGHLLRVLRVDGRRPAIDRAQGVTGRHGFRARILGHGGALDLGVHTRFPSHHVVATRQVSKPGARIVALARRYVGRVPYRTDGSTPRTGFDCSGFTRYLYDRASVASLPHDAQAQRYVRGMHAIERRRARPGDLVFYLSGRFAYHVAVYAGHGMQYAAAVPGEDIVYQHVWSRDVQYRTDWH